MSHETRLLRVAFVGGGSMARAHVRALRRANVPATIVGAYDADESVAHDFAVFAGAEAYKSLDAMFAATRPDVVHVCTTAGAHFDAAQRALHNGANVYVEKPFVETLRDADTLIALAASKGLLVCSGHQLLADPAYEALLQRAGALQPFADAESAFFFRSPTLRPGAAPQAIAAQLLDILPHPLYSLVAALEWMAPGERVELSALSVTPSDAVAVLRAGGISGRLHVSLTARPVASTLSITGENGSLAADFIRGSVTGIDNSGTSPIEKILNPLFDGAAYAWNSMTGVANRILRQGEYPGLSDLLSRFYDAVRRGTPSPVAPDHLRTVVALYEHIAQGIRDSVRSLPRPRVEVPPSSPRVAITGAAGFLGRSLAKEMAARGYAVRGIGRGPDPGDPHIHEWVRADISRNIPDTAFAETDVVIHAAAATSGGFDAHQRHSIDAARNVVESASTAGVTRIVHISSLSVLRPPSSAFERQNESTPLADDARDLGPYTWGKCVSERLVVHEAARAEIAIRVIRPAALIDWRAPDLPGLVGRRLFAHWHLGLGRPGLPIAVCDVERAATAIAWTASNFDDSPTLLNLIDPEITSRRQLLARMRSYGWRGRMVWVPISFLALAMSFARRAIAVVRGQRFEPMAVWQILRPRRFDTSASERVLAASRTTVRTPERATAVRV